MKSSHYFRRLRNLFTGLIADVPPDMAACEFDCRKPNCRMGEWEKCEKRLRVAAEEKENQEM